MRSMMATTKTSSLLQSQPLKMRVGMAALGLSISAWFATNKIFNEEIQVL